jgi:hypothetical protein
VKTSPSGAIVTYADGTTPVLPGDRVSVRLFLRRRAGEVVYVPGISKRRGTYEHNGLTWVGISLSDGWAIGEIVLPDTHRLKPTVKFQGRGAESSEALDAIHRIDQEEREDERRVEAERSPAAGEVRSPTLREWLAASASIGLHLAAYLLVAVLIGAAVLLVRRLL